jgi:predicted ribosomally synthesized peptide with SipW-like signal peptide
MSDRQIDITRRKMLGALGAVGAAGAGAGMGTSALFGDTEWFERNTLASGELDLTVDWQEHYYNSLGAGGEIGSVRPVSGPGDVGDGEVGLPDPDNPIVAVDEGDLEAFMTATTLEESGPVNNPEPGLVELTDVKPGDFGEVTLSYHLSDNPGYVALCAERLADAENGVTEPEGNHSGEDNPIGPGSGSSTSGELGDNIQAALWYDPNCNNLRDSGEGNVVASGTLNDVLDALGADGGSCPILEPSQSGGAVDQEYGGNCHVPWGGGSGACDETLYLTDSGADGTILFDVVLDGITGRANLTELVTMGAANFDQVDAIAATNDGETVYAIDKNSGHLGAYDVSADSFSDEGQLTGTNGGGFPGGLVNAAYSPGGMLYMASSSTDGLYTVDTINKTFTQVATIQQSLRGTDIAFTVDGTLYMISTEGSNGKALYEIDPSDGSVIKKGSGTGEQFTGLGVRAAGTGNLVGSATSDDSVYVIGRDGILGDRFEMYENNSRYTYQYGDMTVGELCTDRPSGHCVALAWWLPRDVGNIVQSDRFEFKLQFQTEQCRNNETPFSGS